MSLAPRERRWLRGHHETRGGGRSPGGARARLSLPRGWSPEATAAARAREVRVSPRPPGRVGRRAAHRGSERRAGCQRRGAPRTRAEPRSPTATPSKFLSLGRGRTVLSIFRAQRRVWEPGRRTPTKRANASIHRSEIHRAGNLKSRGLPASLPEGPLTLTVTLLMTVFVCPALGAQPFQDSTVKVWKGLGG